MEIYHLLYLSTASAPANELALQAILDKAQPNNKKADVTGILIYRAGYFIQLLEGAEANVKALYKKIAEDSRHREASIILEFQDDARLFPHWSMGHITDVHEVKILTQLVKSLRSGNVKSRENHSQRVVGILKDFSRKYGVRAKIA